MTYNKRDRFRGAMMGLLCGDALGAPYETWHAVDIKVDLKHRGGLVPHDYIEPFKKKRQMFAGQPTDDSELTAALGQSLFARGKFDEYDVFARLRRFIIDRESILTADRAYGSGGTLRAALKPNSYEESLAAFTRDEVPIIPTNGSLMRCLPISLLYQTRMGEIEQIAMRQSAITHVHPLCMAACATYNILVAFVLEDMNVAHAWGWVHPWTGNPLRMSPTPAIAEILRIDTSRPGEDEIWPLTGSVTLSLRAALWASLNATDFRDGLTKVISLGGDTDTYGAIAGGILGARFGLRGIPQEWQDVMIGKGIMIDLADQLYELSCARH